MFHDDDTVYAPAPAAAVEHKGEHKAASGSCSCFSVLLFAWRCPACVALLPLGSGR